MGQAESQVEELCVAADQGDVDKITALVSRDGVDVNSRKPGIDWTPLHFACESGRFKAAELLISLGANVNAVTHAEAWGATPLHLAFTNKQPILLVILLLNHGADPNARNTSGSTPLHMAISLGDFMCVRALMKKGAMVDDHCADLFTTDPRIAELAGATLVVDPMQASEMDMAGSDEGGADAIPLLNAGSGAVASRVVGHVGDTLQKLKVASYSDDEGGTRTEISGSEIKLACEFLSHVRVEALSDAELASLNSFYAKQLQRTIDALKGRRQGGPIDLLVE